VWLGLLGILLAGCAHTGAVREPALKGTLVHRATTIASVEARLSHAMERHGWTVVYLDNLHVFADRAATPAERAAIRLQPGDELRRRLECNLTQQGPDVQNAFHTVHVIIEASGESRVTEQATPWDDQQARDNAAVLGDLP